jgi:hypothetical protein
VWTSPGSAVVLAGAQMRAECVPGSRTQQITRKPLYKRLDLQGQKSILATTPPGRPFLLITRKEIIRSAKSREQERVNELRRKTGANPGNARVATRNDGPGLPPRSLIGTDAPMQAQRINALPLPARVFRAGRGRGEWGQVVSVKQCGKRFCLKSLLHLTEFTINCNKSQNSGAVISQSSGQ